MLEHKRLGTHTPDNLIAGDYPIVTESIRLAAGQTLARGSVLGQIQADGQYTLSDSNAADGSEVPVAILAENTDSSLGVAESVCYLSGQFNSKSLVFGAGHTAESIKPSMRVLNIYLTEAY